ncbi:Membrane-anchored ubiquitin-fold protein 1 [Madurella mycetomatis]|uniref:Membrane-anchored ubiquitin-fold protein 1 n=1 Tax=Madurella mycetomatis TaxID=100816 RepID=A0A175W4H1_9PEZI|nr:Membrane-anchored ubiquitin-fold protein 1 [Madurella mycetomatis]
MADGPQTSGGQSSDQRTLPQQTDSVPIEAAERETTREQAEDGPANDEIAMQSAVAATEVDPSKGKDKEESPPSVEKRREGDSLSIGPSDLPPPAIPADSPVCTITLLLPTGARHPYRIDEKYLTKRNVEIPDVTDSGAKDPFSISVYKLKELILREWREEWEGKPASPSSIRLIHFGKLLDDKEHVDSPNVVHMSVRPAEMLEEEEAGKGKTSTREGRTREGSGGCCVIL